MQFQIITPEKVVASEEISQVSIPTTTGEITILPHHTPIIAVIQPGELRYTKNGEEFSLAISGGFLEVRENGMVVILADTAEHAHEINLARAEEARDKAAALMRSERNTEDVNYGALAAQVEKELARLRVGNKYRNLKNIK
jgi:F-type H+-transporting ATPase subunit epsilon